MNYELMIVAKTSGSDGLMSRVEKTLKDISAADVKVDKLGKKTLAFQIKKQTEADYFVLTFSCESSQVAQLSDMLRLEQEDLLRYLFIKAEGKKKVSKSKAVKEPEKIEEVKAEKPKVTVVTKTEVKKSVGEKSKDADKPKIKGKRTSKK